MMPENQRAGSAESGGSEALPMSETARPIETRATRVNVMLDRHGTLAFMDGETARLKEQLGAHVGRSEMIRAVFGAIADASLTLGNCRSEEDVRAAFRWHFRRVADSVRAERSVRENAVGSAGGR